MTAVATTIADDIVTQYKAAFPALDVQRVYVPEWDMDTLASQRMLQVAPNGQDIELQSRGGGLAVNYRYLVALGAKVTDASTASLDQFADLLEQLMDYWQNVAITNRQERAVKWEMQVWPDIEQVRTKSMFLGVFEITFLGTR